MVVGAEICVCAHLLLASTDNPEAVDFAAPRAISQHSNTVHTLLSDVLVSLWIPPGHISIRVNSESPAFRICELPG